MVFTEMTCPPLPAFFLGIAAAALAWHLNKALGRTAVSLPAYLPPLVEESAKTIPAVLLSTDIFYTHFFFGAVEGVWEMLAGGRAGVLPGLTALTGHAAFGAAAAYAYQLDGALLPALAAGYLLHAAWNCAVLKYLTAGKEGDG